MEIEIIKTSFDDTSIKSKILFKNKTNKDIKYIRIEARFYDKDKNLIDLGKEKVWVETPSNSERVEILNFYDLDIDNIKSYELKIASYEEY